MRIRKWCCWARCFCCRRTSLQAQGLPQGFQGTDPIAGPRPADRRLLRARRTRVRHREERRDLGLPEHRRSRSADPVRRLSARDLHGFGIAACSASRSIRVFRSNRTSMSCMRSTAACSTIRRRAGPTIAATIARDPTGPATRAVRDQRRIFRALTLSTASPTPPTKRVLLEDWYQLFPSHSIGTLLFGPDGYLYAGGGDGASYNWADWGQGVGNPTFPISARPRSAERPKAVRCARKDSKSKPRMRTSRSGSTARSCASIPRPARARRAIRSRRRSLRQRATHHRVWLAQSVPLHESARHRRDLGRRCRLEHMGRSEPHSGAAR